MSSEEISDLMTRLGKAAVAAASALATSATETKNAALPRAAAAIRARRSEILEANARDMAAAEVASLGGPMLDRLRLDEKRVEAIARSIEEIVELPDPVGTVAAVWDRANGLHIQRVRVPLGV